MKREYTVRFSRAEVKAVLEAIGQMTDGNNNDYLEWKSQTYGSFEEWRALRRSEVKLVDALNERVAA